ncbi:hypothetical protein ACFLQW_04170 [Candidatus Zixiibacteriota bacterium]
MIAGSHAHGRWLVLVVVAFILGGGACSSEKKERTRQVDNANIREMIAQFATGASERDSEAFAGKTTESFDAAAFMDTLWAGVEAERVVFKVRRLRTSEGRSRAVFDVAFMTGESMVSGKFVAMEFAYLEGKWFADNFQLFGSNR